MVSKGDERKGIFLIKYFLQGYISSIRDIIVNI